MHTETKLFNVTVPNDDRWDLCGHLKPGDKARVVYCEDDSFGPVLRSACCSACKEKHDREEEKESSQNDDDDDDDELDLDYSDLEEYDVGNLDDLEPDDELEIVFEEEVTDPQEEIDDDDATLDDLYRETVSEELKEEVKLVQPKCGLVGINSDHEPDDLLQ